MRSRFSPPDLLLLVVILLALLIFIHLGVLAIAFEKLGVSPDGAILLLFSSLFGSAINIPLFVMETRAPDNPQLSVQPRHLLRPPMMKFEGKTVVAFNVGGCLIPLLFSFYLILTSAVTLVHVLIGVTVVSLVSRLSSRPIAGIGIGMPIFVAPLTAAGTALLLSNEHSAPLAYISGTLGVLIGADLLRINAIRQLGAPFASIGGAGTFDGIFITGIVAVLLA